MEQFRDYLIIDRTQADVLARNEKGVYSAADLNRVTRAFCYVAGCLAAYGYIVPEPFFPAYLITASIYPQGGGKAGSGVYYQGETVHLTAVPSVGFAFTGWMENGQTISEAAALQFQAERNRELTAVFAAKNSEEMGVVGFGTIGQARIGQKGV